MTKAMFDSGVVDLGQKTGLAKIARRPGNIVTWSLLFKQAQDKLRCKSFTSVLRKLRCLRFSL